MAELTLPERVSRLEEILAEQISEYERTKAVPPPAPAEAVESEKERKKRAHMSEAAKAAMKAKREATIAAKNGQTPSAGRRRRTAKIIRMKKSDYLREHHHLFRVLRNPTRRALNAELRAQQKELKERGLKG